MPNGTLQTIPKTSVCSNCGGSVPDDAQFCPKCGARSADLQPTLQQLFESIAAEMKTKLDETSNAFRAELETMVRANVEKITAPLTEEALSDTVRTIAQGMLANYSTQQWRIREIAREEMQTLIRDVEVLGRRVAALEKTSLASEVK
jgi:ribosomal protein L40E